MNSIQYVPLGEAGFRSTIVISGKKSTRHIELVNNDTATVHEPEISGDAEFSSNPALVAALLAYGENEHAFRTATKKDQQKSFEKASQRFAKVAKKLAVYESRGYYKTRDGWCSCCFQETKHREVDGNSFPAVFLCDVCGETTTTCAAPGCRYMARRPYAAVQVQPFCAEHAHDIRSFEGGTETYRNLDSIGDLRKFDELNLAGMTRVVCGLGLGAAVLGPAALMVAPAIGGALGVAAGLSGAAAVNHGLAILGGGALAAGGFGMAGGVFVITATGTALGGILGAVTTTAYVQDDKSFRIEKLRDGEGTPIIVASGFLTQKVESWGSWEQIVTDRYPTNPVYRVHWGAKELKDLGTALMGGGGKAGAVFAVKGGAQHAVKMVAKQVPFVGVPLIAPDLIANPWNLARTRAEKTATVLADLLVRVEDTSFILVGHSLGARVMLETAKLLATKDGEPRLEAVHLLAPAVNTNGDWQLLSESVSDQVYNYHSQNDPVLKAIYPLVNLGAQALGCQGFETTFPKIVNVDVSENVYGINGHSEYFTKVKLLG